MSLAIEVLGLGPLQANCTVAYDTDSAQAVVIDPGGDVPRLHHFIEDNALNVNAIVLTHAHIDHLGGVFDLHRALPGNVPVLLHPEDEELYRKAGQQAMMFGLAPVSIVEPYERLSDGLALFEGHLSCKVLHTPGHSPGSVSLFFAEAQTVVCGDVLFAGSIGRTDLWGGDMRVLLRSISTKLFPLGDEVQVVTGHGPGTTIGQERRHNPFLTELKS